MKNVIKLTLIAGLLLLTVSSYAKFEGGGFAPSSTPTDCAANAVATAIDASGNLTCGYSINVDIQAYDADLDTWAGITPSADIQAFLGPANDTAARTELGLGSLATQNADNATVTNLTANVIKTDTSADATLSGTPIIITVYDAASNTPYYFKAYPTK